MNYFRNNLIFQLMLGALIILNVILSFSIPYTNGIRIANITHPRNTKETDNFNNITDHIIRRPIIHRDTKENGSDLNIADHLKMPIIQKICTSNRSVCNRADDQSEVCTIRIVQGREEERTFKNWCYLFLTNMCDIPGQEYFISFPHNCQKYHQHRRSHDHVPISNLKMSNITGLDDHNKTLDVNHTNNASKTIIKKPRVSILRDSGGSGTKAATILPTTKARSFPKKYVDDKTWDTHKDGHVCPHSCTNDYQPVCLNVNKGRGTKMRFYTFVNHCQMDLYQCTHTKEFILDAGDDSDVSEDFLKSSGLSWTDCANTRYTSFVRFAESASSMGHFGWMKGDHLYSHIMEPHERLPGYGKK